jgi:hypothetical protein
MRILSLLAAAMISAAIIVAAGQSSARSASVGDRFDAQIDLAGQADSATAAERKKRRTGNARGGNQIACTRIGCHPIPRACRIEKEFDWNGLPTGYDAVICPYR